MDPFKPMKSQIEEMGKNTQINIDPENTLLLIVDMMNAAKEEAKPDSKLDFDTTMFREIQDNVLALTSACKQAGVPVACVSCVYDSDYLPASMRNRFKAMGISGLMSPKGSWGAQVLDELLALNPEYILLKSHFSAFARAHTLAYKPGTNQAFQDYLALPASADKKVKSDNGKILSDYYLEAHALKDGNIDEHLNKGGVASLDAILEEKGVSTLIVVGGSTHVCLDAAVCSAYERGYDILQPHDAAASEDLEKHLSYLHNHGLFKTQLTTTQQLLTALSEL